MSGRACRRQVVLVLIAMAAAALAAQDLPDRSAVPRDPDAVSSGTPIASLLRTTSLKLTGDVDSNSPAVWEVIGGRQTLVVMTSYGGQPSRASGASLRDLSAATPVAIVPWPGEGVWIEAIVRADDGTWYGFYHNERVATACGATTRAAPRIGVARSRDFGLTWTDLGILVQAPASTFACGTTNTYFVGGVGDLSAVLDREARFVYFYFSQYGAAVTHQGVGAARLAWADRDAPAGRTEVWSDGQWVPAARIRRHSMPPLLAGSLLWELPAATPVFPTPNPWHNGDARVDAFWGPSVHWNTHLERYVMLLNKAKDESFASEGIYVSFNVSLADPASWSRPARILQGGTWYPQVIGIQTGGSDTLAGRHARFFLQGRSDYVIEFDR